MLAASLELLAVSLELLMSAAEEFAASLELLPSSEVLLEEDVSSVSTLEEENFSSPWLEEEVRDSMLDDEISWSEEDEIDGESDSSALEEVSKEQAATAKMVPAHRMRCLKRNKNMAEFLKIRHFV